MSDETPTAAYLEQFFRSLARPELDRVLDERMERSQERGQRLFVRSVTASLAFLDRLYGFLHADIRRLDQRLDEIHVGIDRSNSRGISDQLEIARYKQDDALAAWARHKRYLRDVGVSIERIANGPEKDSLREQAVDLRRRMEALSVDLNITGARLARDLRDVNIAG